MYKNQKENNENFWISYADLMAGLLFVFILVIGVIIIKFIYAKDDLKATKANLIKEKQALTLNEQQLEDKKKKIKEINLKLAKLGQENSKLSLDLAKTQNLYKNTKDLLEKNKDLSEKQKKELLESHKLNDKQKEDLLITLESLKLNIEEIESLKSILLDYEVQNEEITEKNNELNTSLKENEKLIKFKDDELLILQNQLVQESIKHQKLVGEFNLAKLKVKHLTGLKINVIEKLRDKLGKSIHIDKKSGTIKFSSNILFEQGSYTIKEESKEELAKILKVYLESLLKDKTISKYIQSIVIEGHTNSDGSYLHNLQLSQQRALEVMKFIYEKKLISQNLLQKYLSASGRSYSDRIYINGKEDKDNSRRIEIKFLIKNEASLKELESFLGKNDEK